MLQKDLLRQDMFLIGPPGSGRRRLALAYCEMMNRDVEFLALSRLDICFRLPSVIET